MPLKKKKKVVRKKASAKKKPAKKLVKKRLTKKRLAKKPLRAKKAAAKVAKPAKIKEKVIGTVTHYFPKVQAAVIKLKTTLAVGDNIKIKGHSTDLTQAVDSIQIDHVPVNSAQKGQEIGLLVKSRVREHDLVYKA